MGYVRNPEGIYRTGFRPIATNPYAATQLGLTPRTPFDPERLLGQVEAFTPGGGYVLHHGGGLRGLGNIVPNQSTVTWVGQVNGTPSLSVQDVISAATAALQADGLSVVSSSGLPFAIADIDLSLQLSGPPTVTLQILVNNGMGYSDPSDIAAIVNHELYVASGIMPTGTITVVQPYGGTATTTPGGAAAASAAPAANWSSWLQQNAVWVGLGVLGVFVLPDLMEKF